MIAVAGTVRDGVVVPDAPLDVADGTRADIHLREAGHIGLREDEWPDTPEGIESLIAAWNAEPAPGLTDEGQAELDRFRAEMRRFNTDAVRKQMGLPE